MKTFHLLILLTVAAIQAAPKTAPAPCCTKEQAPAKPTALSDTSIYQVDSIFTNDLKHPVKLSSLAGQPVILTMFFAQCTYACPVLTYDMKKLEAALPENLRGKVRFVLVSFDTDRDTPEALAEYRKSRNIPDAWTLLTASRDDILELTALLGVKYKKEPTGQFSHSNVITLLNAKGEIATQQLGLNKDPKELIASLKKLN